MARVSGTGDPFEPLFYVEDKTNGGFGDVQNVPDFIWNIEHSNACVRDSKRGFSFYYARHIFDGYYYDMDKDTSSSEIRHRYIGRPFMVPDRDILMVVTTEPGGGKTRIVTAVLSNKPNVNKKFIEEERVYLSQQKRIQDFLYNLMEKTF